MKTAYRSLTPQEISNLEGRGSRAESWDRVRVAPDFDARRVENCRFSGDVRLGAFRKDVVFFGGLRRPSGITRAAVHNCTVGDDVFISQITGYLANYDIEDNVIIEDVQLLGVEGPSSFGNGTRAAVINEAGGREVVIYDHLSSHFAYLMALYRADHCLIQALEALVAEYTASVTSDRGRVGAGTRISHCGILKNLRIGEAAVLEGVSRLINGTILSKPEAPSRVGVSVIAEDFIFATDSRVQDGVNLSRCFVGQATELGREYSAENSVFFANCAGFHGEACSIFAGPYTVTHHKATLLIAGLFSFLNAGSGSNQSNHMYKLGPVHQGIVERGSKTGSDSYMLWPMRVGAFSLIMGRHYGNADTTRLPFSYLIEHEGESNLVPAVNLRSVGTIRDSKKWPLRDNRKDPEVTDHIIFHLLNPYTVDRMRQGVVLLETIRDTAGHSSRYFSFNGVKIGRSNLEKGLEIYRLGIRRYLGNVVVTRLRSAPLVSREELSRRFFVADEPGRGEWMDWAGLYLPRSRADGFLTEVREGRIGSLEEIHRFFRGEYERFADYELVWVDGVIRIQEGKGLNEFTPGDFKNLLEDWIDAVEDLDRLRWQDARKEFTQTSRIGYGMDDEASLEEDFRAVRGSAEDNSFILGLKERLAQKKKSAQELAEALDALE